MATHRIRRLRWRVSAATEDDAFDVRTRLRRLHDADLPTEIERLFDATGIDKEVVYIPTLELSLRVSSIDEIGPAFLAGLEEKLLDLRSSRSAPVDPGATSPALGLESAGATLMPLTDFDALVRYLDAGHLPWPLARGGPDRTLARDGRDRMIALLTEAALGDPGALLAYAPVLVHRAAAFFFRWLQLVPESHWAVIADRIEVASRDGWVVGLGDAVGSLLHPRTQASGSHQRQLVAAALLALALRGRGALSSKGSDAQLLTLAVGAGLGDDAHASALVEALPAEARAWIGRTASQLGEVDAQSSPQVKTEARKQATPAHAPVSGPRGGHEAARTEPDDRPDQLGVAVDHAGLVILHPFLPRLLQRAGILPPGGEASLAATSLPRAAALLSLAATGADEPFEFELGFVKVLLGLRPDTDLQVSSGLVRPEDREEVEALLLSVIEHWRALKNTSVAGLRASFLQRPGLLADVGGSWRLRVEPHSIDVLLDGLPWGIGTIRLPWMTEPIATEWATP